MPCTFTSSPTLPQDPTVPIARTPKQRSGEVGAKTDCPISMPNTGALVEGPDLGSRDPVRGLRLMRWPLGRRASAKEEGLAGTRRQYRAQRTGLLPCMRPSSVAADLYAALQMLFPVLWINSLAYLDDDTTVMTPTISSCM